MFHLNWMANQVVASLKGVNKEYQTGDQLIVALQPTTLDINAGEFTLIIGPSGSGKTTLLSLIGCVIYPTKGDLWVENKHVNVMTENQLAKLRLHSVGFVFQNFNLLSPLSAEENVAIPLSLMGINKNEINERVRKALEMVGMTDRRKNLPRQLSGGQQQRIAIARALVTDPKIILCDEPTAALDKNSISVVLHELKTLADNGKSVVVVTHDPRLKEFADRIIEVENGFSKEVTDY